MVRWGEEEKKTKGLGGCFSALAVLLIFGALFATNMNEISDRIALEKTMQSIIRTGAGRSSEQLITEIIEQSEKMGLLLEPDQIQLKIWLDDNGNYAVDSRIDYSLNVNLWIVKFDIPYPISENVTIVSM